MGLGQLDQGRLRLYREARFPQVELEEKNFSGRARIEILYNTAFSFLLCIVSPGKVAIPQILGLPF